MSETPKIIQLISHQFAQCEAGLYGLGSDGITYELTGKTPRWRPVIPEIGYIEPYKEEHFNAVHAASGGMTQTPIE